MISNKLSIASTLANILNTALSTIWVDLYSPEIDRACNKAREHAIGGMKIQQIHTVREKHARKRPARKHHSRPWSREHTVQRHHQNNKVGYHAAGATGDKHCMTGHCQCGDHVYAKRTYFYEHDTERMSGSTRRVDMEPYIVLSLTEMGELSPHAVRNPMLATDHVMVEMSHYEGFA